VNFRQWLEHPRQILPMPNLKTEALEKTVQHNISTAETKSSD